MQDSQSLYSKAITTITEVVIIKVNSFISVALCLLQEKKAEYLHRAQIKNCIVIT
jgi:hypothetical protein